MRPQNNTSCHCARCGATFHVKPSRAQRTLYCSQACYDAVRSAPNVVCETCGRAFHAAPARIKAGGGKLCSMACRTRDTLARRFWAKVQKTEGCWLWTGAVTYFGHGKIGRNGKDRGWTQAHHVAWFNVTGHWPEGAERVLHTCDVPNCVRNDDAGAYVVRGIAYERHGHLFLATTTINNIDCYDKGRSRFDGHWWSGRRRDGVRGKAII